MEEPNKEKESCKFADLVDAATSVQFLTEEYCVNELKAAMHESRPFRQISMDLQEMFSEHAVNRAIKGQCHCASCVAEATTDSIYALHADGTLCEESVIRHTDQLNMLGPIFKECLVEMAAKINDEDDRNG